jgi:hypothetical protein
LLVVRLFYCGVSMRIALKVRGATMHDACKPVGPLLLPGAFGLECERRR